MKMYNEKKKLADVTIDADNTRAVIELEEDLNLVFLPFGFARIRGVKFVTVLDLVREKGEGEGGKYYVSRQWGMRIPFPFLFVLFFSFRFSFSYTSPHPYFFVFSFSNDLSSLPPLRSAPSSTSLLRIVTDR